MKKRPAFQTFEEARAVAFAMRAEADALELDAGRRAAEMRAGADDLERSIDNTEAAVAGAARRLPRDLSKMPLAQPAPDASHRGRPVRYPNAEIVKWAYAQGLSLRDLGKRYDVNLQTLSMRIAGARATPAAFARLLEKDSAGAVPFASWLRVFDAETGERWERGKLVEKWSPRWKRAS